MEQGISIKTPEFPPTVWYGIFELLERGWQDVTKNKTKYEIETSSLAVLRAAIDMLEQMYSSQVIQMGQAQEQAPVKEDKPKAKPKKKPDVLDTAAEIKPKPKMDDDTEYY